MAQGDHGLRTERRVAGQGDERALEQAYVDWAYEQLDQMMVAADRRLDVAADIGGARSLEQNRKGRVKMLDAARSHPRGLVIGRLDDASEPMTLYIGRCHVDGDADLPAVVDWRTPQGERFNQANRADPQGIGRRRTFAMRHHVVEAIDDDLLTPGFQPPAPALEVAEPPSDVTVPEPQAVPVNESPRVAAEAPSAPEVLEAAVSPGTPVTSSAVAEQTGEIVPSPASADLRARDLLLAELESSRSGEMHDVVATIQADQDRLMRADPAVPLLIQGGPGTGKTVVGLHRAAWVLYEQRRQVGAESVLVIGPNPRFLDYIRNVLPSLGESAARQMTLDDVALSGVPAAPREQIEIRAAESERGARTKAANGMARIIANAIRLQARPQAVSLSHGLYQLELDQSAISAVIDELFASQRTYRAVQARLVPAMARRFSEAFAERVQVREGRTARQQELAALMEAATKELSPKRNAILPNLDASRIVNRALTEAELLAAASAGVLDEAGRASILRARRGPTRWTTSDLPLIDEAHHLITGEITSYSHVVIDEAQDLSPMQWRVVMRRAQRASVTILGDIAQGTAPWAPTDWGQVLQACGLKDRAQTAELRLGYRIPRPVSEFACRLLPEVAPGIEAPTSFRDGAEPVVERINGSVGSVLVRVNRAVKEQRGLVAVVAPARLVPELRKGVAAKGGVGPRPVVLEPHESKGLEFDTVIVVEPAEIAGGTQRGLRGLFVALTRATKHLLVLTSTELPGALRSSSPLGVAPLDTAALRVCACGLAMAASWRHCPVCGAAVPLGASGDRRFTQKSGQIGCVAHENPACEECDPPVGYEATSHGWRPKL